MQSSVSFVLDGKLTRVEFSPGSRLRPTTTVLQYLRGLPDHKGVKEGCAEGDCGACTIVVAGLSESGHLTYHAVDSCLLFLPMLHGKQVITVENLRAPDGTPHPVQREMVRMYGSQCGFCTPGIVMSMFALTKSGTTPQREEIIDALAGNLCRCTGYKPIIEAAEAAMRESFHDHFATTERETIALLQSIHPGSVLIDDGVQCYSRPATLGEAFDFLRRHSDALIIAGATDVALRVTKRHELLTRILDVGELSELQRIVFTDTGVSIGSVRPLHSVLVDVEQGFPALSHMLRRFGSRQIRNLATLGGNVGTSSPIGDTLPVLIAYGANVVLQSRAHQRTFPVEDFILGYRKTVRNSDELIVSIDIPKLPPRTSVRSYKVSKRRDVDISTVSGGFRVQLDPEGRVESLVLAYGGMADHPSRAGKAEEFLRGKPWHREWVERALPLVDEDFNPISDARSGATFRRVAARNLLLKFWSETSTVN